jgi:3-dehydroquinate dehydratase
MADQALQLEKMAALEKSSREQLEEVKLLEARVDALEQDNSALKDKASKLQEKVKAAAKEKKGIFFFLLCPSSSFLLSSRFP